MVEPIETEVVKALYEQAIFLESPSMEESVTISSSYPATRSMGLLSLNIPVLISGPFVSSIIAHILLGRCFKASFMLSTV